MQKLFSMFPQGAPGLALLLLRLYLSTLLLSGAFTGVRAIDGDPVIYVACACALAIVIGFMTPIATGLTVLIELIGLTKYVAEIALHSFAPIAVAVALALLGPGAYSLDARLFGRRLIEFGPDVKSDVNSDIRVGDRDVDD